MRTFEDIRQNYRLGEEEEGMLHSLAPLIEPHADQLVEDFYQFLLDNPETAKFLQDPDRLTRLKNYHRAWLLSLFTGPFNEAYFQRLERIGLAHVRIGLSAHFVYVAMNFLRERLKILLAPQVEAGRRAAALAVVDKILDLNLDVIARAYHQAELRRFFLSYRLDDALVRFARRFTFGLNLLLLAGLIGLAAGMVVVLVNDLSLIFRWHLDKGLIAALGSLLVLWLAIELLEAEIDRLRGGELQLSLFVGVGLVAFIRKILIATLSHEDIKMELVYLGGIFIFGIIYWLLSRAQAKK
ncbi:MAG: protoglobin domain-containing protein [Desulfobaccales bacterium]